MVLRDDWNSEPILVVSPHYDDAILSAFAVFASRPTAPRAVLTVFSGEPSERLHTEWDAACGFSDSSMAITERRAEDAAAFAGLAVDRLGADLLETQHRQGRPLDDDRDALVGAVMTWFGRTNGLVLLPVGAGGERNLVQKVRWRIPHPRWGLGGGSIPNIDHLWISDVLIDALPPDVPVGLYEEQPYSWIGPGDVRAAQLARLGRTFRSLVTAVDRREKARRIECYRSQVPLLFSPWVRDIASVVRPTERVWIPDHTTITHGGNAHAG